MADPVVAEPKVPDTPVVDAGKTPSVESPAVVDAGVPGESKSAEPPVTETKPPEPPKKPWQETRLEKVTAQKRALEQELATVRATQQQRQQQQPGSATEEQVQQLAMQRADWMEFNRRCQEAADIGRAAYPDFDARVQQLGRIVDKDDKEQAAAYNLFLAAALETGEAPRLIATLSTDLNEAARIMSMPPMKMASALTKMALADPGVVSQAPNPIKPIGSRGASHVNIAPSDPEKADNLTTRAWMERRNAEIAAKSKRR